jgi:hypothetical protein
MPSPDTFIEADSFALLAAVLLALRMIRPIGSPRPRHSAGWLDAHQVPAQARHYLPAIAAPGERAALPPAPEAAVDAPSPWVPPSGADTRPDTLTIARTTA